MARRKTDAEFRAEVKALVGDEYTVLETYTSANTKIKVKHNECGYVYRVRPASFLRGNRCPKCMAYTNHKLTDNQLKDKISTMGNGEYEPLQKSKGSTKKILMLHKKCGTKYYVRPNDFFNGKRCPICSRKNGAKQRTIPFQEIKKKVALATNGEYIILPSKYNNVRSRVTFYHKKCGNKFKTRPYIFLLGHRCPFCNRCRVTDKMFKTRILNEGKNQYFPLQKYRGADKKVLMLHKKCGKKYYTTPSAFYAGCRCPICRMSKGEKAVEEYLKSKNIIYVKQYRINRCRDLLPLPFDFAVFDKKQELNCLIEYQGEQHFYNPFKNKKHGQFTLKSVLRTQKHDAMKLQYCKDHGIKLIRINHPQTSSKSNSIEFIERLVNRTLNKELHVV